MADFTPEIASEILAACQQRGEDASGSFSRALGGEFAVSTGETRTLTGDHLPDTWNGPGLVITFHVGDAGALLLVPEASELLPEWCSAPDDAGQGKLATLAQELGYSFLPETFTPDNTSAARVKNLAEAFQRAQPASEVGYLPLNLTRGEKSGEIALVWPMQAVTKSSADSQETADAAPATGSEQENKPQSDPQPNTAQPEPESRLQYADLDDGIRQLPKYAKSLLKVRVPVTVTLASTKYAVNQILELGPGSIIQFNKSCEDNLTLEAGDHPIASGEAVKVGDKFGLWITSMTLPDERFWVIHGRGCGARVK